jgi:hypothetical protein
LDNFEYSANLTLGVGTVALYFSFRVLGRFGVRVFHPLFQSADAFTETFAKLG